ncbi:MAG: SUMF1/EgtB/PvdO family nonheme iron enzyme [Myxococcota bacterium]
MYRRLLALPPTALFLGAIAAACGPNRTSPPATNPDEEVANPVPTVPRATPDPAPFPTSAPAPDAVGVAATAASDASAPEDPAPRDGAPGDGGPTHCPAGMVLVEGEYCTEVRHTCLVEWYAPQNKKRVCEQFEPKATCVGKRVAKRYCIDKYAYPNVAGERPEVMNNFYQAQVKCAAQGKRMCTESEWTFACEGPDMKPFPHGYVRDPRKCNGDHEWDGPKMTKVAKRDPAELARLWRGVPSGSQPECVSDFGVADLPGNNDEVVAGESRKAKYSSVNTGGPWYSGVRNQCRPKIYSHEEGFYYYFLGFRCCAEPDGAESDPRTPRQVREGWSFGRVEGYARFTTEQMEKALALKAKGECTCEGNRLGDMKIKSPSFTCDTMCGTLLGPGAKDGDDSTRVPHRDRKKIR